MPIEVFNASEFVKNVETNITARTGLNIRGPNSKVGIIANIITEEFARSNKSQELAQNSQQVSTAVGTDLDALGLPFGIYRYLALFANCSSNERNITFYVDTGAFGDINDGSNINIPAGTIVKSNILQNDKGQEISYKLTQDLTCLSTSSVAYASAQAVNSGVSSNVGEFVLRNHSLPYPGLKVVNFYPILNGRNQEEDTQFRFRIMNKLTASISVNRTTSDLVAISVPGVIETKLVDGMFGPGTSGLIVLGSEFKSNSKLIRLVQEKINAIAPTGSRIVAMPANKSLFTIKIFLVRNKDISRALEENIKNRIMIGIKNYLRSVGLGGEVTKAGIYNVLRSQMVVDISLPSIEESLLEIRINRSNPYKVGTLESNSFTLEQTEYADLETLDIVFGD